jgi:hypothetical protein
MRKVTMYLPEELTRALKMKAAEEFTTIGKIVARAVERELKGGEKKK